MMPVSDFSILTKPTSKNTVASSDLAPNPLSGLDSRGVIAQGFLEQLPFNSPFRDFEKVEKGRKMSSQLWYAGRKLRMAGKFMTTYFFAYNLSSQLWYAYAGRKLKTMMWLRMAGKIHVYIFFSRVRIFG